MFRPGQRLSLASVLVRRAISFFLPYTDYFIGITGNLAVQIKYYIGADDALDIFALHGVCGFLGTLMTGIFATDYIAHLDGVTVIKGGWLNHHWVQLAYQLADACAGMTWSFACTYLILMALKLLGKYVPALRLRVDLEQEEQGIDEAEIGEFAYDYVERKREVKPVVHESESQHSRSVEDFGEAVAVQSDKEMAVYSKELRRPSSDQGSINSV